MFTYATKNKGTEYYLTKYMKHFYVFYTTGNFKLISIEDVKNRSAPGYIVSIRVGNMWTIIDRKSTSFTQFFRELSVHNDKFIFTSAQDESLAPLNSWMLKTMAQLTGIVMALTVDLVYYHAI